MSYEIYSVRYPDVKKIKRLKPKLSLASPEDIARQAVYQGVMNRGELERLRAEIDKYTSEAESGIVGKIVSKIYYWMKDHKKISPETLYKIMANFDKIKGYMPNDFWRGVVDVIDKIGEYMDEKGKKSRG